MDDSHPKIGIEIEKQVVSRLLFNYLTDFHKAD